MDEVGARRAAETARVSAGVPAEYVLESAERRIIEVAEGPIERPSRVRDCLAWVVRFSGDFGWRDLAIEDATGLVVRVERSK
jgi:hypothetical protein